MKITILQTDIAWNDTQRNILGAQRLMQSAPPSDLYVLPEMWPTGFCTEPGSDVPDEHSSAALRWMTGTARERHCALAGSLAIRHADGTLRNRHYLATPQGISARYDKHHLFTYGHEDKTFTPGGETVTATWQDMRLLLLTCYDLRFPAYCRYGRHATYDAIVIVASWPAARQEQWEVLLRARAIENQCYVIAANRTGSDPVCAYTGGSAIIDPKGQVIALADDREQALTADIDLQRLQRMRQRFPVLDDRDKELFS